MIEFEWDEQKSDLNLQKHKVPFTEAATVFGDDLAVTVFDEHHSNDEDRYVTMGMSVTGRVIIVCHTDRGKRFELSAPELPTAAKGKRMKKASKPKDEDMPTDYPPEFFKNGVRGKYAARYRQGTN